MKKILISGGAGYLGTELTLKLLKKNEVYVYDEFNFNWLVKRKTKIKFNKRLFFIKKNIIDIKPDDFKGIDIVCDLNGIPNDPASELNKNYTWKINFHARKKFALIAKKAGVKHYIFNSTCAVYGHNKKVVNEKSTKNPISTYAKANYMSEKYVYSLRSKKFKVQILRNATLFGVSPSLRLDLVINIFAYEYMKKRKIVIDGTGNQWRPFISVKDVCNIYNILVSKNKSSFVCNLVSFNMTVKILAKKIIKVFKGKNSSILYKEKNFDLRNYNVSNKKFKNIFKGYKFASLKNEIKKLQEFYKKNKVTRNKNTIRMLFYKNKFSK